MISYWTVLLYICALVSVLQSARLDKEWNGYNYTILDDRYGSATYWQARSQCQTNGGDLVTMATKAEAEMVEQWVSSTSVTEFWIGLTRYQDNQFRWVSGESVSYASWDVGYPQDSQDNMCACRISSGAWQNFNCQMVKRNYMCKIAVDAGEGPWTTPAPPVTGGYCPQGSFEFVEDPNKCFTMVALDSTNGKTMEEAKSICRSSYGHLADLLSVRTQHQLVQLVSEMSDKVSGFWVGLYRPSYDWYWTDNSYINTALTPGTPWGSDCGMLVFQGGAIGTISAVNCEQKMGYVCQFFKDKDEPILTPPPVDTKCTPPYEWFGTACYRVLEVNSTWTSARAVCEAEEATLVSIHSHQENAFMQLLALRHQQPVWIGLYKKDASSAFTWSDGWYLTYMNWDKGRPSDTHNELYVYLDHGSGKWTNTKGDSRALAICEINYGEPVTFPPEVAGQCPYSDPLKPNDQWIEIGQLCYNIQVNVEVPWLQAMEDCLHKNRNSVLASIHAQAVNAHIYEEIVKQFSYYYSSPGLWIGLFKDKEQELRWIDGSPVQYVNWTVNSPDMQATEKNCVRIRTKSNFGDAAWEDADCSDKVPYICMTTKELYPTVPAPEEGDCPGEDWADYGATCFLFASNSEKPWSSAREDCRSYVTPDEASPSLVYIASAEENNYVRTLLHETNKLTEHRTYWLGLKVAVDGSLRWDGGQPVLHTNWAAGEPRRSSSEDLCVVLDTLTGMWSTNTCDAYKGYACRASRVKTESTDGGPSGDEIAGIIFGVLIGLLVFGVIIGGMVYYLNKKHMFCKGGLIGGFDNPLFSSSGKL